MRTTKVVGKSGAGGGGSERRVGRPSVVFFAVVVVWGAAFFEALIVVGELMSRSMECGLDSTDPQCADHGSRLRSFTLVVDACVAVVGTMAFFSPWPKVRYAAVLVWIVALVMSPAALLG